MLKTPPQGWSEQQDLNLRRTVVNATCDSDKGGGQPPDGRSKPGGDSDNPAVRPDRSHRPRHDGHTASDDAYDPSPAVTTGKDDPLLARLRKLHGGRR